MISIVIIVKNDRAIEKLLAKLKNIYNKKTTEVIVVDASNGNLDDIKEKYKFANWIYFPNNHTYNTSIPEQRNKAIEKAKGDIIIFVDSDCVPANSWISELVFPIQQEKEYIVAGRVINSDQNSLHSTEFDKNVEERYLGEAPTMNLAIRKEVFNKIGVFDINFQYGEDVDLMWRARKAGFQIRFAKNAIVYHDLGDEKNEIRRMLVYGEARVRLYKKHLYRYKYLIHEMTKLAYPLFFLFLPVTFIFPLYPLIGVILLYKSPGPNLYTRLKTIKLKTYYGIGMLKGLIKPV